MKRGSIITEESRWRFGSGNRGKIMPQEFVAKRVKAINGITYKSNTSGYKGVHLSRREEKWIASIQVNKKLITIGYFPLTQNGKVDAAHAYDKWVMEHLELTAYTNFPRHNYPDIIPNNSSL